MTYSRRTTILVLSAVFSAALLVCDLSGVRVFAQTQLTYPEVITALQSKLPNSVFRNKTQLTAWVIAQIRRRKMDKPLTKDREDDLRQAGATDGLIEAIRENSPALPAPTPAPDPGPVDLGDLVPRSVNLVKPDYTPEAKQAKTMGVVKLALELDENGRVTSVTRLSILPNGLTERAVEAARVSTFRPATRDGKPAKATGILTYNFRINLIDVAATLAAAHDLRGRGDCDRAIAEYTRVMEADSKNVRAIAGRGLCHLIKGDHIKAEADLSSASGLDTTDPDIPFSLAIAQDYKGDTERSAANYRKAAALGPNLDRTPAFNCLFIDRKPMNYEQARAAANPVINACNQALRGAPPHIAPLLYYKRGIGFRMKGEFDRAIAELEAVRRSNPNFTAANNQLQIAYNSRGLESFNKKDYRKAFDDVTQAIQVEPTNPTPYINRCAIQLYAWKQYSDAIADCSEAIRLSTRSSTAYSHRGYAYEMSNSRERAIADYRKALELDPQNQAARTNLNRLQTGQPSMKSNY
jgi:TonB family protein